MHERRAALSNRLTVTVQGPPAFSVADAEVREAGEPLQEVGVDRMDRAESLDTSVTGWHEGCRSSLDCGAHRDVRQHRLGGPRRHQLRSLFVGWAVSLHVQRVQLRKRYRCTHRRCSLAFVEVSNHPSPRKS